MKQIQYTIALIFTLFTISSCEVENGTDVTNQRTLAGKYVFDSVENMLTTYILHQNDMLKFDAYLQADESKKPAVLKHLLPGYEFFEEGDTAAFYGNNGTWRIVRASTDSLSSPLASWSVGCREKLNGLFVDTLPFGCLTFTRNKQGDAWILEVKESEGRVLGKGSFEIKRLTNSKLHSSWLTDDYSITTVASTTALTGNANPLTVNPFLVNYNLSKPFYCQFIKQSRNSRFVSGAAEMHVVAAGSPSDPKDQVSAEIDRDNYEFVTIHFRGITELFRRWNQ